MIGNKYVLRKAERNPWLLRSFDNVPVAEGSVIKVVETVVCYFNDKITGVIAIEVNGVVYKHDPDHPTSWAFFTDDMTNDDYYGIFKVEDEKVVHKSAGTVGVSRCDSTKAYLNACGKKPLEQRYNEWVLENIHIYDLFCKFTLEAISAGHAKISHWLIVNRLRWEVEVVTKGMCEDDKDYKISNDYIAFLARDFIKDHPEHKDIFNLKQMKRV